jgi:hypothetical protein
MADTAVAITAGSGTNIDTRTEATNGNHRQVVVLGDPATNAGVAPVDATNGLTVDLGANNDVTVTSISTGDNNIGNVDIVTVPADPFGANADAAATADGEASISAKLRLMTSQLAAIQSAVQTLDNAISGSEMQVDVVGSLPAGNANIGDVDVASIAAGDNNIGNVDVVTMPTVTINAIPAGTNNIGDVDIASSVVLTTKQASSTGTLANVASSASSVTLLASNASRLGATIHNDSTQILYVKFGTTASATSYTVKMVADAYYECPFGYTGRIDGIWASANGNARVTELT